MLNFKRILVPTDFSNESRLALDSAIILGKKEKQAQIILLHVLPIIPSYEYMEGWFDEFNVKQWQSAKKALAGLVDRIPAPLTSSVEIAEGRLPEVINKVCLDKKVSLVVMTTHGRHGWSRMIHPNQTEEVVRSAPCPVMVFHLKTSGTKLLKKAA